MPPAAGCDGWSLCADKYTKPTRQNSKITQNKLHNIEPSQKQRNRRMYHEIISQNSEKENIRATLIHTQ